VRESLKDKGISRIYLVVENSYFTTNCKLQRASFEKIS